MSEVKVNKVSPRSGTTVTIGDNGDTINIVGTLQNNGSPLAGDISSVVAGTGLSGGATSGVATLNIEAAQPTITSLGTITGFTSTGIDDNATSTAITINSLEQVALHGSQIQSNNNTGSITYSGGNNSNAGANLTLFGGSHASTPNVARFRSSATEVMRILADGKIGIGTSSPGYPLQINSSTQTTLLHLVSTAGTSSAITFANTGSNDSITVGAENDDLKLRTDDGVIKFFTNENSEKMRIDSSGLVRIGNTSSTGHGGTYNLIVGNESSGGDAGVLVITPNNENGYFGFGDSGGVPGMVNYNHGSNFMRFYVNSSERMRINSSGSVGIGTSSPGTVPLNVVSTDGGNVDDILELRNNSTTTGTGVRLRLVSSTDVSSVPNSVSISSYRNAGSDHDILFESSGSEKMRIRSTGSVGIGTGSPSEQLDISSTGPRIRFSDTSVTNLRHVIGSEANDLEIRCDDGNVQADSHIGFKIDGTERMRIDSSGNLIIGATSIPLSGTTVNGVQLRGGSDLNYFSTETTASQEHMRFINPNGRVGSIRTDGSSTTYNTSSDYRLKENVVEIEDATTRLKQLKPKRFNFIADANKTVDGFLAHEVSSLIPEAVSGTKDETETKEKVVVNSDGHVIGENIEQADWETGKIADEDGNTQYPTDSTWEATKVVPVYQGIDQSKLVPLLVKTIQELEARITTLENA